MILAPFPASSEQMQSIICGFRYGNAMVGCFFGKDGLFRSGFCFLFNFLCFVISLILYLCVVASYWSSLFSINCSSDLHLEAFAPEES